jgi:hypothetical protein
LQVATVALVRSSFSFISPVCPLQLGNSTHYSDFSAGFSLKDFGPGLQVATVALVRSSFSFISPVCPLQFGNSTQPDVFG